MAITIEESSLLINDQPAASTPYVDGNDAYMKASPIIATGTAKLVGGAHDSLAGWQLGFIQVELMETNWAYYRGPTSADGSCLVQYARGVARPRQVFRDTAGAALSSPRQAFYDAQGVIQGYLPGSTGVATAPAGARAPIVLTARHLDIPSEFYATTKKHGGKRLFLEEAQMEMRFFSVLSVRDPAGHYQHLKWFYWNLSWQAKFRPSTFSLAACPMWSVVPVAGGNSAHVGAIVDGTPDDPEVRKVLVSPQIMNANQAADYEDRHVIERYAPTWQSFDVTR